MKCIPTPGTIDFHSVVQSSYEPIVVLSGAGIMEFGNRAFNNLFKITPDDLGEISLSTIKGGIFNHEVIRENLHFLFSNNEQVLSFDLPHSIAGPGKKIRVHGETLAKNEQGEVIRILLRFEDMTERITHEIALKQKTREILERTTPITKIWDQILVIPMIGTTDSNRVHKLTEELLIAIRNEHTRYIIIEGNGVTEINTAVAIHIINTISAIHLLGAHVILTGVKPELALILADVGKGLENVISKASLPEGIQYALSALGYRISHEAGGSGKPYILPHETGYGFRSPLKMISPLFGKR